MFHIVLYQPEIPQNTGNIIRLCANAGATLHLVKPLGFVLNSAKMKSSGLDYHEFAKMQIHETYADCSDLLTGKRIFALTTKGHMRPSNVKFQAEDVFLFGPETRGLPADILNELPEEHKLRLPMQPESRSLNLSNSVAITVFEAWRQLDFIGGI